MADTTAYRIAEQKIEKALRTQATGLDLSGSGDTRLTELPESLGQLTQLGKLDLSGNRLTALPASLGRLDNLERLEAKSNPFHPELAAAVGEGLDTVKRYLRAQAAAGVALNKAKLILIGEGEVGKSCLFGALRGDPWEEDRPTTHGIKIKPVRVKSRHRHRDPAQRLGFRRAAGLSAHAPVILHRPGRLSGGLEAPRRPAAGVRD